MTSPASGWIDMASFTPISALLGGAFIGLAAVILILGIGHILGMSGIANSAFKSLVKPSKHQTSNDSDGSEIQLPTSTDITPQLIIGSMIFGIGWVLLGFCPAPALAGYFEALVFLIVMLVGFWLRDKVRF